MQCAARSSGRVRLNEPRNDFASGVRELATITASLIKRLPTEKGGYALEVRVHLKKVNFQKSWSSRYFPWFGIATGSDI